MLGCNTPKSNKDENDETNTEKSNDFSLLAEQYGFSESFFGSYNDGHGNSYDPDSNSFWLDTPYIEGLVLLQDRVENLRIYRGNPISDITFLENFTQLKFLEIYDETNIENIESLKYLHNLETLFLSGKIENMEPLQYLQNLTNLEVSAIVNLDDKIIDISPLGNLINLNRIRLYYNTKIKNAESIFELVNLEDLFLQTNEYTLDLRNISSLSKLKELHIYSPAEIDLTNVGTLPELKRLSIGSTKIINMINLRNPELERLDFHTWWGYPGEFKLDGLHNLEKLMSLNITHIDIYDVSPLLKIPNLLSVSFTDNFVDITPLMESNTIKNITVYTYYKNTPKYKEISEHTLNIFKEKGIEVWFTNGGD